MLVYLYYIQKQKQKCITMYDKHTLFQRAPRYGLILDKDKCII